MLAGGKSLKNVGGNADVFLSYSRDDQKTALPIIAALESAGYSVWWDGLLGGGERFANTTEQALENARAVVVLWSRTSLSSHWVHDEATRGRDRGCLVPLSIDGSDPPLGFRQFQVIDVSGNKARVNSPEMQKLVLAVAALHDHESVSPRNVSTAAKPSLISRRAAIGAGAFIAGGSALALWKFDILGPSGISNSVAVLPFANLSGDETQDYFSDGLSEELRTALSLDSQIEVAARTSSSRFKDQKIDAKDIAKQLGVANIVEGAIQRAEEVVRISVQLIDGKSGKEKWSQRFDRKMIDIFAVQSEIADLVADGLVTKISSNGKLSKSRLGGTKSNKAYDAFLRGKAFYNLAADEKSDRDALLQFDAAIREDPKFASAYAAKSRALTVIANNYASGVQTKELYAQAVNSARMAIDLVPDLAEAQAALGFVMFNGQLDVKGAGDPYQKSFERGFGNADILSGFANYAARTGKFIDARSAIARAKKLDPLNPAVFRNAGVIEYCDRKYDDALPPFKTALSLNPKMSGIHQLIGDINYLQGNLANAKSEYSAEPNSLDRLKGLAIIEYQLKNPDQAKLEMAKLIAKFGDNSLYQQAQILAQWGDLTAALTALEKAHQIGDSGMVLLRNDPLLDKLRKQPRFVKLLTDMGFE